MYEFDEMYEQLHEKFNTDHEFVLLPGKL